MTVDNGMVELWIENALAEDARGLTMVRVARKVREYAEREGVKDLPEWRLLYLQVQYAMRRLQRRGDVVVPRCTGKRRYELAGDLFDVVQIAAARRMATRV